MTDQIQLSNWQLGALTVVLLLAFSASLGMAFNIDAIALSFNSTNTFAGLVASVEMASIAAGTLIFSKLAARLSAQLIYIVGILTIVTFNFASIFVPTIEWLIACRSPAGFAMGAVVSTVMTTAGRSDKPEYTFGVINSMVGGMGIFIAFVLPRALELHHVLPGSIDWSEMDGLYIVYVLCAMSALLFVSSTPRTAPVAVVEEGAVQPKLMIGYLGLAGLGIIFFGHGTLGLFIVKIGRSIPLTAEVVGYVFMAGSAVGVVLPLVAGYIGTRMKALVPLTIILAFVIGAAVFLAAADTPIKFFIFAPVFAMLPIAIMPIFLGCLARVDPTGSLAGAHPAFIMVGGAIAPFAGGALSDFGGYTYNGWFVVACVVIGAALALPVTLKADALRDQPQD